MGMVYITTQHEASHMPPSFPASHLNTHTQTSAILPPTFAHYHICKSASSVYTTCRWISSCCSVLCIYSDCSNYPWEAARFLKSKFKITFMYLFILLNSEQSVLKGPSRWFAIHLCKQPGVPWPCFLIPPTPSPLSGSSKSQARHTELLSHATSWTKRDQKDPVLVLEMTGALDFFRSGWESWTNKANQTNRWAHVLPTYAGLKHTCSVCGYKGLAVFLSTTAALVALHLCLATLLTSPPPARHIDYLNIAFHPRTTHSSPRKFSLYISV